MQIIIKSVDSDGYLFNKGPVILNRQNIVFLEKMSSEQTKDIRFKNIPYNDRVVMDDIMEQKLWLVILNTQDKCLVVDNETALKIEKWLK